MEALDRLDWAGGAAFAAAGVSIGIRASDSVVLEYLPTFVPSGWKRSRSPPVDRLYSVASPDSGDGANGCPRYYLYGDAEALFSSPDLHEVLDALESELHFQTAVRARKHLFVHAGAVAWRAARS